MRRIKSVLFFPNGNIAAFDENDLSIQYLQQKSAVDLFFEHAAKEGFMTEGCRYNIGQSEYKIEDGFKRKIT